MLSQGPTSPDRPGSGGGDLSLTSDLADEVFPDRSSRANPGRLTLLSVRTWPRRWVCSSGGPWTGGICQTWAAPLPQYVMSAGNHTWIARVLLLVIITLILSIIMARLFRAAFLYFCLGCARVGTIGSIK